MKYKLLLTALFCFIFLPVSHATAITIDPSSDGSLYTCSSCNTVADGSYVLVGGYIQGDVKFSTTSITAAVSKALLSLNPYALPLTGTSVDIYGYGTSIAALDVTDANAGTYLGTLVLPSGLGYGQDVYFDVTSFINSIQSPYVAFNLRTTGTDSFSSLEYNFGHPSQLLVTTVPEPMSILLLLIGLLGIEFTRRNRT